ncbi:MAG: tRNA pseudouridine(55) synthase TruB [Bacteroidales bacterium]|nr:tRNA pseudouridine(55) synthase TruB [Bacteroidales bacterium]
MVYNELRDLQDLIEGRILLFEKPLFWTSFDLVKKVKALIEKTIRHKYETRKRVKVGHAGTLDPLAEGLMILGTGKKTKILESIQSGDKEYITTLEFGKTTPSFDLETMFDHKYTLSYVPRGRLEDVLNKYIGEIDQVPPQYSAKSVRGKRAYKAARRGENMELSSRRVRIGNMEILHYKWPIVTIRVNCSKGTYIRALARDIGDELNVGAHIIGLKRTRIESYHLEDAFSLEKFEQKIPFL